MAGGGVRSIEPVAKATPPAVNDWKAVNLTPWLILSTVTSQVPSMDSLLSALDSRDSNCAKTGEFVTDSMPAIMTAAPARFSVLLFIQAKVDEGKRIYDVRRVI